VFDDATPVSRPAETVFAYEVLRSYVTAVESAPVSVRATASGRTHPGTLALEQLRTWLQLPLDRIVGVVALSPSTRAYWRSHPEAPLRLAKGGRLLRLRDAVGLLVGEVGAERARAILFGEHWLERPLDEGDLARLEGRVRGELLPHGLIAPTHVGHMTTDELRRLALSGEQDEQAQQTRERGVTVEWNRAMDAAEEA
jgi:hypothetical protein